MTTNQAIHDGDSSRPAADLPYRVVGVTPIADARASAEHEGDAPTELLLAGRVTARRTSSNVAFIDLTDRTGTLQLLVREDTENHETLRRVSLGDWIAVRGLLTESRTAELSLAVRTWELLAPSQRSFPSRRYPITDPDTRQRQRYLDVWDPAVRRVHEDRCRIVASLRHTLTVESFLEVETPMLHPIAGGANARPFATFHNALDVKLYLRVAPELYLKRLIVGGFDRVFEIGRVFRNEGISPRHNPEFTILEAYQAFADFNDMMALTERLVSHAALAVNGTTLVTTPSGPIDLAPPWRRATMDQLVLENTGVSIGADQPLNETRAAAGSIGVPVEASWGSGRILAEVFDARVERHLVGPVFVTDHPEETSPLARRHRTRPGYTERFEAIVAGRELCNAFSELNDPDEQYFRFLDQASQRAAGDDEAMSVDLDYVEALRYGLPPTGGLGLGVDRLVMLLTGTDNIRDIILFPTLRVRQDQSTSAGI